MLPSNFENFCNNQRYPLDSWDPRDPPNFYNNPLEFVWHGNFRGLNFVPFTSEVINMWPTGFIAVPGDAISGWRFKNSHSKINLSTTFQHFVPFTSEVISIGVLRSSWASRVTAFVDEELKNVKFQQYHWHPRLSTKFQLFIPFTSQVAK